MVFETIREFLCEQLACDESRVTPDTVMLEDLEMEPSDPVSYTHLTLPTTSRV